MYLVRIDEVVWYYAQASKMIASTKLLIARTRDATRPGFDHHKVQPGGVFRGHFFIHELVNATVNLFRCKFSPRPAARAQLQHPVFPCGNFLASPWAAAAPSLAEKYASLGTVDLTVPRCCYTPPCMLGCGLSPA
jgi:hypothetical protein